LKEAPKPPPPQISYNWVDTEKLLKITTTTKDFTTTTEGITTTTKGATYTRFADATYIAEHIVYILANMKNENDIIKFLEHFRLDINKIEGRFNEFKEIYMSVLSYFISRGRHTEEQPIVINPYHKLIRWLIEHGADVNYTNQVPRLGGNNFTILSRAMYLLFSIDTTIITTGGLLNLKNLNIFYDCVYTLVLLLSRKANMLQNIRVHAEPITTPLQILQKIPLEKIIELRQIGSTLTTFFKSEVTQKRLADDYSKKLYSIPEKKVTQDRVIQELKELLISFERFLYLQHPGTQEVIDDVVLECQSAVNKIRQIQPVATVCWMIETAPGSNTFDDMNESSSNIFEESFKMGVFVVVSGSQDKPDSITDFIKMKFTEYQYVTVGGMTEKHQIEKRLWRDIRPPPVQDKPETTATSPGVIWQWESDDGTEFIPFDPSDAEKLEQAFHHGLPTFQHPSRPWLFNFGDMIQTNTKSNSRRAIQRINPTLSLTLLPRLPPNWEQRVDHMLKKEFFYNKETKEITWNRP
jgi:hypothetical protein